MISYKLYAGRKIVFLKSPFLIFWRDGLFEY